MVVVAGLVHAAIPNTVITVASNATRFCIFMAFRLPGLCYGVNPMSIVSVSWGDHLDFGEGDGRLATPESVARRMQCWRDELGADTIHWRVARTRLPGYLHAARGAQHPLAQPRRHITWDDLALVPQIAHDHGLRAYLYVSVFDEGWPLPAARVRRISYHNAFHGQQVAWQSRFCRERADFLRVDRANRHRQWGVASLAYPWVRTFFRQRFLNLLLSGDFDGLFLCLRSQSRPADHADQFGFNDPVCQEYMLQYGTDIRFRPFDLPAWRDLEGEFLTRFLAEVRDDLRLYGKRLAVGCARGDVLGPPLGNTTLAWRTWVQRGLIDELVINQDSSRCPSTWLDLWPMHRGTGYVQNYLTGEHLPALPEQLDRTYGPALQERATALYVARQWDARSVAEERVLSAHPAVAGLVFSSFRHDNPDVCARNEWRIN